MPWINVARAAVTLAPKAQAAANALLAKVAPNTSFTKLFTSPKLADKQLATEVLVRTGTPVAALDKLFDTFGVAERQVLVAHAMQYQSREIVANDKDKDNVSDGSALEDGLMFERFAGAMAILCIKNIDDMVKVSVALDQLTSRNAAKFVAQGVVQPKLGYR